MTDDPLDPTTPDGNIDVERLSQLILQIGRSFLFFVVNFCWIENKTESGERIGESKFMLWPAQRPVTRLFLQHRLLCILKARQLGLTWLTAAYVLWRCITRRTFLAVVISAKEEWAIEFLDRVRFMFNRLPEWLKPDLSKDGSQQMRFVFEWSTDGKKPIVYSEIKSLTTTQEGAQSKTPDILVMDETARNRYAKEIFGASKPGIDKAGGQIVVISNAHKRGPGWSWTRDLCSGAYRGENTFHFLFMPWWDCPERLTEYEREQMMTNPRFVPSVFKDQQVKDGVDPQDVSENYPNTPEEALSTSQGSYFGDTLSRHGNHTHPGVPGILLRDKKKNIYFQPAGTHMPTEHGPNVITIWRYPYFLGADWDRQYWSDRYCLGADVSEGQGRSYSVAYVMDRQRDELVARVRANRIDAVDFAQYLWYLSQYYTNFHITGDGASIGRVPATICVEKTGAGITTVKELAKVDANQYIWQMVDKRGDGTTDAIGWHETEQTKHLLCGDLRQWFKTMRGQLFCRVLIDEASTTIENELGRLGPEKGKMWDAVIGAGCALQASYQIGGPPAIIQPYQDEHRRRANSNWGL